MNEPLKSNKGFWLACRQSYQEATEYYSSKDTFLLSLHNPGNPAYRFPKGTQDIDRYLRRTQRTQPEFRPTFGALVYKLSPTLREQWQWFLVTLLQMKSDRGRQLLKSLFIVHRRAHKLSDEFRTSDTHPGLMLR